jgi:thiosulfate dehydrogenase
MEVVMRKRVYPSILMMLIGAVILILAACTSTPEATEVVPPTDTPVVSEPEPTETEEVEEPTEAPMPELVGDSLRGGLLYDKWWTPLGLDAPEEDQPLWATQDTNERSGGDTWRCKECHGWDYKGADGAYGGGSHFTGFSGILQLAGGDAHEILGALQGSTNPDHDFSVVMDDQALTDLALFVSEELVDYASLIGEGKAATSTDLETGEALYQGTCANCHGPDGMAINFNDSVTDPEFIAGLANGNPWEVLHKMRFGQPGVSSMPSTIDGGWTLEEQGAVLAYAQSLPENNFAPQGGLMYDKWWNALGIDAPEGEQPLWATQDTNERSGGDTWRCKECHGWDYRGAEGAYGSGSHFTGFAGVLDAAGMSSDELVAWLDGTENPDHDFSTYFDEMAIKMMVAFLQNGTVDMTQYINDDKTVNGDPAVGEPLYTQNCALCHGDAGQMLNFGDADDPEYLADLAAGNPWEVLHKAANGQPGASAMPAGRMLGWNWQDLADLLSFIQSLPKVGE